MTTRFFFAAFIILILIGCKSNATSNSDKTVSRFETSNNHEINHGNNEDSYIDDTYCAEVKYYNPNTGTHSSYTLTVKIESDEIVEIDMPNGGRLNENNFSKAVLDDDGYSTFTNNKGYEYEVQIIGQSENCFENIPMVKQCKGTTKSGKRCRHMTDNCNQLCWQHQNQE